MPKPLENWCVLGPRIMLSKTVLRVDISKIWSGFAEPPFLGAALKPSLPGPLKERDVFMGFRGPPACLETLDKSLRRFLESLGEEALELRAGFSCGTGLSQRRSGSGSSLRPPMLSTPVRPLKLRERYSTV